MVLHILQPTVSSISSLRTAYWYTIFQSGFLRSAQSVFSSAIAAGYHHTGLCRYAGFDIGSQCASYEAGVILLNGVNCFLIRFFLALNCTSNEAADEIHLKGIWLNSVSGYVESSYCVLRIFPAINRVFAMQQVLREVWNKLYNGVGNSGKSCAGYLKLFGEVLPWIVNACSQNAVLSAKLVHFLLRLQK
ncbi:hypothetical protein DD237_008502 [Peronospora effusa]|uniref:Uncharacterized protein n=1 Tax=Peronospora effusa TaxID=542832 RepID=A0A3R7XQA6_9STRA|nr:hypothetical protein DD237_008502 [Peronospora effusa]